MKQTTPLDAPRGARSSKRALWTVAFLLLLPLALAACDGPVGPEGPAGPPGPGERFVHIGVLDAEGYGEVLLPDVVGHIDDPPLLACYVADEEWYWYAVNTDFTNEIYCYLEDDDGSLYAVLDATFFPGWWFAIVVVY